MGFRGYVIDAMKNKYKDSIYLPLGHSRSMAHMNMIGIDGIHEDHTQIHLG